MEDVINKAIKGGYYFKDWNIAEPLAIKQFTESDFKVFLLDPLFWKSIGKVCEWKECYHGDKVACHVHAGWFLNGIHFQELNLDKGWEEAVKWLKDLTANQ